MLEVTNLEVVYNNVMRVLRGVSLRVEEGQIVALLGPNGTGKTTLLRSLTGLLSMHDGRATKGDVRWKGQTLLRRQADEIVRDGVAQVMEGRRIFADLSVEENLKAGGYLHPKGLSERIDKMYGRFPVLAERRKQSAGYLSGGEQQMLAIARVLMARPKLLLLDEPSLGLAPRVVGEVSGLIRSINAEGVSVLLVEQNAAMALSLADHGYVMENGKVVHEGTAEELKNDEDIQEFYVGVGGHGDINYRDVKHYRRRKRWLS